LQELSYVTLISYVTSIIVNCSLYLLVLCRFFQCTDHSRSWFLPPSQTAVILNTFSGSACSIEARKRICILCTKMGGGHHWKRVQLTLERDAMCIYRRLGQTYCWQLTRFFFFYIFH